MISAPKAVGMIGMHVLHFDFHPILVAFSFFSFLSCLPFFVLNGYQCCFFFMLIMVFSNFFVHWRVKWFKPRLNAILDVELLLINPLKSQCIL